MSYDDGVFPTWTWEGLEGEDDGVFPAGIGLASVTPVATSSILGHEFVVAIPDVVSVLGHKFTIPSITSLRQEIPQQDQLKLTEGLAITREEPEQLLVEPVSRGAVEEKPTEQQRAEKSIGDMEEWLIAAAQMQKVLGEKLKNRTVTVDPKRNPAVREAIRRLFGEDSGTITYEMYKKALEWRTQLIEEGRNETYGTGS